MPGERSAERSSPPGRSLELASHTVWQVKASTLCNLRCRYCYEWERLDDRRRMSLAQWRRVLESAAAYRRHLIESKGGASQTFICWHGGEPSLLPRRYVEDVLDLQAEVFGGAQLEQRHFLNAVQTNLYRVNPTVDLMVSRGFLLSVSMDFKKGARVDRAGRDAEAAVLRNLEQLLGRGASCGVALVLGRHNHAHLPEIHDHLDGIGASWLNVIPILAPPAGAPSGQLPLTPDETVRALFRLYEHRQRRGGRLRVSVLDRVRRTVEGFRRGAPFLPPRDRSRWGETRIVVHPDGNIASQAGSTQPDRILGNIFDDGIGKILEGEAYRASLDDDRKKLADHCEHCRYETACDHRAVLNGPVDSEPGPCKVESKLCDLVSSHMAHESAAVERADRPAP